MARTFFALAVVALAGLAAGGCGGDGVSTAALTSPPAGATEDKPGFNPFSEVSETSQGGREVIANPTLADVMLAGPLGEMSWGRADAPVTIIKYASLTCPYCRKFHLETWPQLKKEFVDTGQVRFIIREFPIGKSSGTATVALRCAPADKYMDLYGKFLSQQSIWVAQDVKVAEIGKVAAQVGITGGQFQACLENRDMIGKLNWVKERGRKLGVIGTPNFFVNGRLVKSIIGMPEIRAYVAEAQKGPRPATAQSN
ncbi:MAG TPA: DsbA family protein [Hyphomicrobiaceae bacterium]|nr:DsbA family protein [Hyphomicrobiaceae bacterium]